MAHLRLFVVNRSNHAYVKDVEIEPVPSEEVKTIEPYAQARADYLELHPQHKPMLDEVEQEAEYHGWLLLWGVEGAKYF